MTSADTDMKMKILLAAKKLFAAQGFDGTSVRQICEEAGANVALVSYYFGGKENVFGEVFRVFFPGRKLREFEPWFRDPVTGVAVIIREVIRLRFQDPELVNVIQQEVFKHSPRIETVREHLFPVWRKLRELLQQGRNDGIFRFRSLDNTMLFVLGSAIFHKNLNFFQPIMNGEQSEFADVVRDTLFFVFNGLGAPEAARRMEVVWNEPDH